MGVYTSRIYRTDTQPEEITANVLIKTLQHFDLHLPTLYFAPHTRAFPWKNYRYTTATNEA
jgi:hypothetical protein